MEIWINPECSKCQVALETLDAEGVEYTVRRYLDDPPTVVELEQVLDRLNLDPWHIARLGEPAATELGLVDLPQTPQHRSEWVEALAAHPILIQRPIITAADGTARVARDADAIREAIDLH